MYIEVSSLILHKMKSWLNCPVFCLNCVKLRKSLHIFSSFCLWSWIMPWWHEVITLSLCLPFHLRDPVHLVQNKTIVFENRMPSFMYEYIMGWPSVAYCFQGTCDLDLDLWPQLYKKPVQSIFPIFLGFGNAKFTANFDFELRSQF